MADATIGTLAAADQAAIRAVSDRFSQLLVAQDLDSLVRLYTENAVAMPPHQPACRDERRSGVGSRTFLGSRVSA